MRVLSGLFRVAFQANQLYKQLVAWEDGDGDNTEGSSKKEKKRSVRLVIAKILWELQCTRECISKWLSVQSNTHSAQGAFTARLSLSQTMSETGFPVDVQLNYCLSQRGCASHIRHHYPLT